MSLNAPGTYSTESHSGWENSIFQFQPSSLWGKKYLPLQHEGEKDEKLGNKIGLKGCKWSSLNARGPGTSSPEYHSSWENSIFQFQLSPLWGNKNWPLQYKGEKIGKFGE